MVTLLSEVLVSGKGCPLCGCHKSEKARTCRACISEIGAEATRAVNRVIEATFDAMVGNAAANSSTVVRGTVWGPFLANTRIDLGAEFHPAKEDIGAYWHCKRGVPGGFVSIFVFGDGLKAGDKVCGLTELKVKFVKTPPDGEKRPVHYFRVQVVPDVITDVRLAVLEPQNIGRLANDYLPAMTVHGHGANPDVQNQFSAAIGFSREKTRPADDDEED